VTFAQWVRETRDRLGMNQEECAALAGVHQSVWSEYEKEGRTFRPATVKKIAKGLRVSEAEALEAAGYRVEKSCDVPAEVVNLWQEAKAVGMEAEVLKSWRASVRLATGRPTQKALSI
jgi:transcriptional regulator with XRE-family HTH domain